MASLKFRDLSRLQPEFQDDIDRLEEFGKEHHSITTALLGAVIVEHDLETLLRSKFRRKDDETWATLVADNNGPLNSFGLHPVPKTPS
jgi:hypothetical protein